MKKKLIITLIVLTVLAGAGTAAVLLYRKHARTANPVKVYSLEQFLGDWYGNQTMMDGMVQAGSDQSVYIGSDQIIKEVCVSPGDEVKIGDVLLRFDTEKLELHIETLKADHEVTLANMAVSRDELKRLKRIRPVPDNYVPEPTEAEKALQAAQEKLSEAETIVVAPVRDKSHSDRHKNLRTAPVDTEIVFSTKNNCPRILNE